MGSVAYTVLKWQLFGRFMPSLDGIERCTMTFFLSKLLVDIRRLP